MLLPLLAFVVGTALVGAAAFLLMPNRAVAIDRRLEELTTGRINDEVETKNKFDSLVGSIGWQASYAINDRVQPYARVAWNRQFEDLPAEAFARSQTLGATGEYAVPGLSQDKDYATLLVGARTHVAGFDANFGVTGTVGQDSADDASAFVTVGRGF